MARAIAHLIEAVVLGAKVSVVTLRISRFSAFWTNGSADIDPRHLLAFSLSFIPSSYMQAQCCQAPNLRDGIFAL
jgi:hypothetical protein